MLKCPGNLDSILWGVESNCASQLQHIISNKMLLFNNNNNVIIVIYVNILFRLKNQHSLFQIWQ